ncbi:CFA/I fimbrial auxiliary subunit [Klebsiella pneumoniae]|uniref:CFA/I fimbrial auxiliary subunit n=1 Tax=Klebsiella pneumoniae TaxID=573 RepID=A0A377TPM0_KLEPN|nr:CFA/I fimbrial auxiliary subunit [Klebsiella pneumoniae]
MTKSATNRIVWFDQALSDAQCDNANRSAVATASARIGTILVVAPRQVNYRFSTPTAL